MIPKLNEYRLHLQSNPKLRPSTIQTYIESIKQLINKFGDEPNIKDINNFIIDKYNKRQPHVKYAIKEFLLMDGRRFDVKKLPPVKPRKPIRQKNFLSKTQLQDIINDIEDKFFKTIAILQAMTGSRASEIIQIETKRIKVEDKRIKIIIIGKGDSPRPIFLTRDKEYIIKPYMEEKKKYLFLKDDNLEGQELWKCTRNIYKQYQMKLNAAGNKHGVNIATHDLRRSVANNINIATGDIFITQKLLGQSSTAVTERYLQDDTEKISQAMLQFQKGF